MPSTYSTNVGLELIATGEKSGSWGSVTNGNLEIIDAAIHGSIEIDLTGEGSSYDLRTNQWLESGLTVFDGTYKVVTFTGGDDPGVGNRITANIVPSTSKKLYFIRTNSLSYGIEISQGTGAAKVNIDNGDSKIVYCDGNNNVIDYTANLAISSVDITGGTIDGTSIGATTTSTGAFTSIDVSGGASSEIDNTNIGLNTPKGGAFTTFAVSASGSTFTVNPSTAGTLDNVAIGQTASAAGTFTTINATSNVDVTGTLTVDGSLTLGDDVAADTVAVNAAITTNLIPSAGTENLGSSDNQWNDLYIDGTANIDSLVADTADINGGTIDNTVIGGTTAVDGTFDTVTANTLNATSINASNFYETAETSPAFNVGTRTFTLDANNGSLFICQHTTANGVIFDVTNVPLSGKVFTLTILHDYQGGAASTGTSTFPGTTYWPNGLQPSEPGPGETDIYTLFTYDGGTTWYAGLSGTNMS
tara:strand:- start:9007 stop:10428 length:1422 start_codon:yes stop_codon:yes gene_type:complete